MGKTRRVWTWSMADVCDPVEERQHLVSMVGLDDNRVNARQLERCVISMKASSSLCVGWT